MNKIYRLVWSKSRKSMVVVAENAKGQGKSGNKSAAVGTILTSTLMTLGGLTLPEMEAHAVCTTIPITGGNLASSTSPDCAISLTISNGITSSGTLNVVSGTTVQFSRSTLSGGIANSGSIYGGSVGIKSSRSSLTGGITNSGTITSGSSSGSGIILINSTFTGGINNIGSFGGHAAIQVLGGRFTGGITNSGTIGVGSAYGISLLSSSSLSGGITNTGKISSSRQALSLSNFSTLFGGINNSGTIVGGTGIAVSNFYFADGINNSGSIATAAGAGITFFNSATFSGGITNSGTISTPSNTAIGINSTLYSGGINNSGSIVGNAGINVEGGSRFTGGITNSGTISIVNTALAVQGGSTFSGGINNTGSISGGKIAISVYSSSLSGGITNSGRLSGNGNLGAVMIYNTTLTGGINNSGTIANTSSGSGIYVANNAAVDAITNTGTIKGSTVSGSYGIQNFGTITTLNNAQGAGNSNGALTYSSVLPTTYNIIVNSFTNYGQLSATSVTGTMGFGIYSGSTFASTNTYTAVFSGITAGMITGSTSGSFGSDTYSLFLENGSNNIWDLTVTVPVSNITGAGTVYQSSNLGTTVNPVFDGGTLQVSSAGILSQNFTVNANNGVIDQNGVASTFSGVISNAVSGTPGAITIANTGSGGSVTFTGINTYTGSTTINSGATLALSGTGSIATSSGVLNNGSFSIAGTTAGASITSLAGSGTTTLGSQTLSITNGSGTYSGAMGGTGGLTLAGGTQNLSGINTYTGSTTINSGATLALSGTGSIATSSGVLNNGSFSIAGTTAGASITSLAGSGTTTLGSQTLSITNGSGTYSGAMGGTGGLTLAGGTQNLSGINTYTGSTTINSGATLALSGTGSIATSSGVLNNGSFSIAGTTAGASITSLAGSGTTTLGSQTLSITNGSGTYSGAMGGTGGLTLAGGTQNLSGINTYTGSTTINSGATLALSGTGSIATSSGVINNGSFNVAAKSGNVALGGTYRQASTGSLLMSFAPTNNQQLNVTGAVTVAGTLNLNATSGTYNVGRYTLITGNGVSGTFGALTSNLSSLTSLSYGLTYDANDVYLNLTKNTYVVNTTVNNNPAGAGAAQNLTNIAANPTPAMAPVITALNALSGQAQSNAISQTLPVIVGSASLATANSQRGLGQIVQSRQSAVAGLSAGEDFIASRDVWMKAFGGWANQNDVNNVSGYKINTGGLAIGGDYALSPKSNIGGVFAFANSNVNGNNAAAPSSVSVNSYQIGGYGDTALRADMNWNYQADIGVNQNTGSRGINFMGTTANSSYNSYSAHLGTGITKLYPLTPDTRFIPSVRADYLTVQSQSYTETNAGALNLSVNSQTYQELLASANFRLDHDLTDKLKVTGNVGAGYNLLNNQVQITSTYAGGGAAFATNGLQISPWLYNAGLGIVGQIDKGYELTVRYDVQATTSGYLNQMASAKLRISF